MKADDERSGRCGVIALALAALALPGIASGSLFGGLAAVRSAADILGQPLTWGLAGQLFVLAGMVVGLLVSSGIIMFLIMAARRSVKRLQDLRTAALPKSRE